MWKTKNTISLKTFLERVEQYEEPEVLIEVLGEGVDL